MGMFEAKVKVANLAAPNKTQEIFLLVDTGRYALVDSSLCLGKARC